MAKKSAIGTSKDTTGKPTGQLVPVVAKANEITKVGGENILVYREAGTTLVIDRPYVTRNLVIHAEEIYFVDDVRPRDSGAWLGEADKVAWRDPATGYECIMMRATNGGYLGGYVGVPPSHPLYGFDEDVVPPELGIEVHGGLTYSKICAEGPTPERRLTAEARRICHTPRAPVRYEPTVHASEYRVEDAHAWWFGFECNHAYDVIPADSGRPGRYLRAEVGGVYRDDAYVCTEILNLAAQLRAIEDGASMPVRVGPPLPPIGLDPRDG